MGEEGRREEEGKKGREREGEGEGEGVKEGERERVGDGVRDWFGRKKEEDKRRS